MHSNRSAPTLMSIEQMYSVVRGETGAWGIEGYEVPKKYCDPLKQMFDREIAKTGKGKKPPPITKRGHFLDDLAKPFLGRKVPVQYNVEYKWVSDKDKEKQRSKSAPPAKRMTFIDDIFLQNTKEKYPKPGPGKYNENRSIETLSKKWQSKAKIKPGERQDFLQDYQHLGATLPGPGQHNPHTILPKIKPNPTDPKKMIAKHKEDDAFRTKLSKTYPKPDCITYKPIPVDYETFGKSLELLYDKKRKVEPSKIKYWGNPNKPVTRNKSETKMPPQYNLIAYWPGKEDGSAKNKEQKKFNWMNKITRGVQGSIYY